MRVGIKRIIRIPKCKIHFYLPEIFNLSFASFSYKEKMRKFLEDEDDLETVNASYHIADVSQMDVSAINSTLNSSVDMK